MNSTFKILILDKMNLFKNEIYVQIIWIGCVEITLFTQPKWYLHTSVIIILIELNP